MIESHLTSPTAHLQSADFTCQLVNAPRNLRNFYKNFCCGMRGRDRQGSQVENFVNSDTLWGDGVDGTFSFVLTATMASWHQRGQREVLGLEILQLADQDLQVPFHCLGQKMESLRAVSRNHGLRGSKSGFSLPTPFFHSCHQSSHPELCTKTLPPAASWHHGYFPPSAGVPSFGGSACSACTCLPTSCMVSVTFSLTRGERIALPCNSLLKQHRNSIVRVQHPMPLPFPASFVQIWQCFNPLTSMKIH